MVATGFLRLDIAGYGGLAITDEGIALLRGDGTFHYRADTAVPDSSAVPRERRGTEPEETLTDDQATLLSVLKALRLELAKERGVPAYVVFHDRTLIDIVRRRPRSRERSSPRSTASAPPSWSSSPSRSSPPSTVRCPTQAEIGDPRHPTRIAITNRQAEREAA